MSDRQLDAIEVPLTRAEREQVDLAARVHSMSPAGFVRERLGFPADAEECEQQAERNVAAVPESQASGERPDRGSGRAKPGALRAELIAALSAGPRSGEELARRTGATESNLRYNLARLQRTGLVVAQDRPTGTVYELRGEAEQRDR